MALKFRGFSLTQPINRLAAGVCALAQNVRAFLDGGFALRNPLSDRNYLFAADADSHDSQVERFDAKWPREWFFSSHWCEYKSLCVELDYRLETGRYGLEWQPSFDGPVSA